MIELGNTTERDLGILRGVNGLQVAILDPKNWEARTSTGATWCSYDGVDGWGAWPSSSGLNQAREWRRKPLQPVEAVKQDEPAVTMAAEIARLKSGLVTQCGITQTVREQLRSALASQKAAEAALEAERTHGCWLRNALEMCAKYFGSASVDDLRQHIAKTLRDIDKTAGKE